MRLVEGSWPPMLKGSFHISSDLIFPDFRTFFQKLILADWKVHEHWIFIAIRLKEKQCCLLLKNSGRSTSWKIL